MMRHDRAAVVFLVTLACSMGEAGASSGQQGPTGGDPSVVQETDIPGDIHRDSWARLPRVVRENLDTDGRRAFDVIVNPESRYANGLSGPVGMWMYSPELAENLFPARTYLRYGTKQDQRLTELVILATARELRSRYVWTSHEPAGLREGLEPEIIELVKRRADLGATGNVPGLGERERAIIQFVREVVSEEKVRSATFSQVRELFGERGVMDIAGLVGYYGFVDVTIKTFDLQHPPGRELLLPDLW